MSSLVAVPGRLTVDRALVRRVVSIAAVFAFTLSACSSAAPAPSGGNAPTSDAPKRGGTIVDSQTSDAKTLQPLLCADSACSAYTALHYNAPLLRRDPETQLFDTKYGTAESYEIAPDGLSVQFKLKPSLLWSDGKPITAGDYKFTLEKILDPKVEYPARSNYAQFATAEAPDDRTFIVRMKEAFCPAINQLTFQPVPKHVFENLDVNDNPFNQKPTVGSGPWLLQEWNQGSQATFVANDKFYLGRPNVDKYVYRIVSDNTVQYSMLKNGDVDLLSVRPQDWDEANKLNHLKTYAYYPAAATWDYIGFNTKAEFLRDVKVRQALAHSIDRQKVIDRIRFGHAKPMNSIYASASWVFNDAVAKYTYDPERAKRLLEEAGWRAPANDANGTRVKDGKPLKMRIFYNAGNTDRETIATVMQQSAKAIGVELEVISEEFNAYLTRTNRTRDVELFVLGWSSTVEPHTSIAIWSSDGTQNNTQFASARVDELFKQGAVVRSCDDNERKKIYGEIQKLVADDAPYIFLYERESLLAVSERFVVNPQTKSGIGYRPWEWYSKTGK